jgi:hypothetical protein
MKVLNINCIKIFVLACLPGLILLPGCKPKYNEAEIPAYIRINKVALSTNYAYEGDAFQNISDCWVSVNEQTLGAYEFPVSIPVLESGRQLVSISAGVKENGITNTRDIYPFFSSIDTNLVLARAKVDTLKTLVFHYKKQTKFPLLERFEGRSKLITAGPGNSAIINDSSRNVQPGFGGTLCLGAMLTPDAPSLSLTSSTTHPYYFTQGKACWAEVSYNIETPITIGLYVVTPSGNFHSRDIVLANTTNGAWKKIYVNFTTLVAEEETGSSFTFYIYADKANGSQTDHIYLDNIKILTLE